MSVVIVGGNDRMAGRYKDICTARGFKSNVFAQDAGRGQEAFRKVGNAC